MPDVQKKSHILTINGVDDYTSGQLVGKWLAALLIEFDDNDTNMKVLLVFVATIIIIANYGSAKKSEAYCIKKLIRPKDLYVNGVKTKKYDTKIIRVCCDGYTKYRSRCVPLCEELCINSYCVAPNTCSCKKGFTKLNEHRCAPVCDNCKYGVCVAPGVCVCYKGYVKDNSTGACSPVCGQPCINGYCSDPDFCTCNEGYKISRDNLYKCEWNNTLTTTTENTAFETSTLFAEDTTILNELHGLYSTLPEELLSKTFQTVAPDKEHSFYNQLLLLASSTSIHKSTVTPFESTIPSTKAMRIAKRKSKALYQMMLFADPLTTERYIKEVTEESENKASTLMGLTDVPSESVSFIDKMHKMSTQTNIFERSSSDEQELVTEMPSTKIPVRTYDTTSSEDSTIQQQTFENVQTPKSIFDKFEEYKFTAATTLESVDYTEILEESNDIMHELQEQIPINEVKSSKFTLKDILIVVYSLLTMLAIIGIYILLWFICSCRRFHEKEYHIAKIEMKKGTVKYSADRNDVITAW